jgi:hypothetical protein
MIIFTSDDWNEMVAGTEYRCIIKEGKESLLVGGYESQPLYNKNL